MDLKCITGAHGSMLKDRIPTYVNFCITAAQSKQELTGTLAAILTKMKSQPASRAVSLTVRLAALDNQKPSRAEEEGKCGQSDSIGTSRHPSRSE